jgi:nucleotide-binding universal stress UspA family protein
VFPVSLTEDRPSLDVNAVVFATDLSDWSRNAGLYAEFFAKHFAARLLVCHAFVPSQAAMEAEAEGTPVSRQRRDVNELLRQRASELSSTSVGTTPLLLDGIPEEVIPRLAGEYAPSLIVLGTHGGGRLERACIGSVAEEILRSTPWPCLTVGPHVPKAPSRAKLSLRRILYATDLTPAAAHAASFAVCFAEALGARIDILNVIRKEDVEHADRLHDLKQRFYDALDRLAPRYAREFCDSRTFVEVGEAHQRILEHIKDYSVDLLVLGIKKSSHLGVETRTSGAFQLLAAATCPVLTVIG